MLNNSIVIDRLQDAVTGWTLQRQMLRWSLGARYERNRKEAGLFVWRHKDLTVSHMHCLVIGCKLSWDGCDLRRSSSLQLRQILKELPSGAFYWLHFPQLGFKSSF